MYELLLNGERADIDAAISVQISYAIDDVAKFAYRNTSFSKQIVLPSTAANNKLFGHVYELGSNNPFVVGGSNLNGFFSVSQVTPAELRLNGLLILKGVFRLIGIKRNRDHIEYEGALFGELGGFMAQIGNQRLENLDFSEYNHVYNTTNIAASWTASQGSGYFYPLIDYGTYSTNKVDYDIRTLRPAMYVKEYLDKMFEFAGYTYESSFFNTSFFKSLIIPNNSQQLKASGSRFLEASENSPTSYSIIAQGGTTYVTYDTIINNSFLATLSNSHFEFDNVLSYDVKLRVSLIATSGIQTQDTTINVEKNGTVIASRYIGLVYGGAFEVYTNLVDGDIIRVFFKNNSPNLESYFSVSVNRLEVLTEVNVQVPVAPGDNININDTLPKGIYQKDFFASILKMFNLYITEDPLTDRKLLIKPYTEFYGTETIDWTLKIARDKSWDIVPMGNLTGRLFEYKYKDDTDYFNESYKKKYNQNYGDRLFDTGFQFSKDRDTTELIFASSPLVQYSGTDKYLTAIYKRSKGNSVDQEELVDSSIRILQAKNITGVASWNIKNGASTLSTQTNYGYAGHLNDPVLPTIDINFGAPNELYCSPDQYTSNNLFNTYWSEYIAEIADKDSKILKCYVYLSALDIASLDFSKPVFIDGVLFRLNKVEDYDYRNNELTKVELLKVING